MTAAPSARDVDREQAPAEPAPERSSHLGTLQLIEFGEYVRGLRPPSIIRIDLGIGDDAILPNHVSSRHRQRPAILAIEGNEIGAELLVDRLEVVRQVPA